MNKATIFGRLGQDPELRTLPNGTPVVSFSVATTRKWKDRDGVKQEETEWHNVEAWARRAEVIAEYFSKGDQIVLEGRLKTDKWEKDGITRYKTKIVLDNFHFVSNGKGGGQSQGSTSYQNQGGGPVPVDENIPF